MKEEKVIESLGEMIETVKDARVKFDEVAKEIKITRKVFYAFQMKNFLIRLEQRRISTIRIPY